MPCRVELTDAEIEADRRARTDEQIAEVVKPLQKRNDELTHENDELREIVLSFMESAPHTFQNIVPPHVQKKIQEKQQEHRREDLRRLEEEFRSQMWDLIQKDRKPTVLKSAPMQALFEKITKVQTADPRMPLEPQLGFDPDAY